MMLLIKRQVAPAICRAAGLRLRGARPAAQVGDLGRGGEEDPAPQLPYGMAEIHVLRVEEETLVEEARGVGVRPAHEQARAADPVHELLPARLRPDPRRRSPLLAELVEGTDHAAER